MAGIQEESHYFPKRKDCHLQTAKDHKDKREGLALEKCLVDGWDQSRTI